MTKVHDLLLRVRRTPDRLFHPLRRRKAAAALRARPRPNRLLVVCHGNICRSPMAAALLRRALLPHGIEVRSAGLIGFNRPTPPAGVAAAARHNVNLVDHRSQPLTVELVRSAGLIVVMDDSQRWHIHERFGRSLADILVLGDLDPERVETRTIRDPVDQSQVVFEEVYERIARCVRELVTALVTTPSHAPSPTRR